VNDALIRDLRVPNSWDAEDWTALYERLADDLERNSQRKQITTKQGHLIEYSEQNASISKPIIDEIDRVLARHYGFTDEELDFIINYDLKYRLGRDAGEEAED
jgi:CRISPR/Cas system-associated endoribonuclease Cas2